MHLKNNPAKAIDYVSNVLLKILSAADQPLETKEIEKKVCEELEKTGTRATRSIILKRLHILRGKGLIDGKFYKYSKGVWVWWKKGSFTFPAPSMHSSKDIEPVLTTINSSDFPLDTKEVVDNIPEFSREQVLHRLTSIWGDGVIKGKQVGSGKGIWIWWRLNAFEK
ncbi:hypothetical protein DRJ25_02060 [Candidatus Woesearchaeota archaeon]|nr:MAG: hypothetical protein DRJ25_02060 [Candidatus Woesearchaeota archaeon]